MTLDDEIAAAEDLVDVARSAATEHLERAKQELHLGSKTLARYDDFLNATILNARSTLARCRDIASASFVLPDASAGIAQGLLAGVRESMRLMYVAMAILEESAGSMGRISKHRDGSAGAAEAAETAERDALRCCSFCGKTESELRLVAGPAANICAACTRLACEVLGIAISEVKNG